MKVYIGWDDREAEAYRVAVRTLKSCSGIDADSLNADRLRDAGMLWRISDHRGPQMYDLISNAKKSTAFACSRFLTPILAQSGWALFTDCDVVFQRDPMDMLKEIEPGKAVYVVQHNYTPSTATKMDGQAQTMYPRKNWSSVMLFDCSHPSNRRLSLHDVNERPGRDLHRFYWLSDEEIGSLDPAWNWLVNEQLQPAKTGIAHFTLGGPWLPDWVTAPNDQIWLEASRMN